MSDPPLAAPEVLDPDAELLAGLRRGEEAAFMALVERYAPMMLRVALGHVRTRAVAEEVVQEAWLGVLKSLPRFEGRALLRTWLLRILVNLARTRGVREARSLPFSAFDEPAVDPDRFQGADGRHPGGWAAFPTDWATLPEERLLAREALSLIDGAIRELPARQQEVIVLRDVEGWSAEEVCEALELSQANQRVLLHRARSRVRVALELYMEAA